MSENDGHVVEPLRVIWAIHNSWPNAQPNEPRQNSSHSRRRSDRYLSSSTTPAHAGTSTSALPETAPHDSTSNPCSITSMAIVTTMSANPMAPYLIAVARDGTSQASIRRRGSSRLCTTVFTTCWSLPDR